MPRSKKGGAPTSGTVTAKLSAGGASVKASGTPVKADATFTYTAPKEKNKTGNVNLEARSKRGIGKADIAFDTKQGGYQATGTTGEATLTGTVADPASPFTLAAVFPGGTGELAFKPSDSRHGTIDVSGAGGIATIKGNGTYSIAENDDGTLSLTGQSSQCVDVGSCNTTAVKVLLKPKKA